jgi:D-aminopeptidase
MDFAFDARKIDALFADVDQSALPGAAVGVAIGGRPVYRKGFGLANIELPLVLSPATRMRIGSTTKHFTCFAYLLLCEEGRAGIDDSLGKHLPELHPSARGVTLRQLMGNTSGLHCACTLKFLFSGLGGRGASSADLAGWYRDIGEPNAAPGTHWIYNNGGFALLSEAIERITRQPLEQVLRERVFEPIGMHDTMLRRWDSDLTPNSAAPHMLDPSGRYVRGEWGLDFAGGGAMVSTVDDMLRWLAHMSEPRVGSSATWALMTTAQVLANGTSTGYGLGLRLRRYRGVDTVGHAGGWLGASAQMLKVPAAGLDVIVIVNREDRSASDLADRVIDACLPGLPNIEARAPAILATGVFRSPSSGRVVELFARDGQQMASFDGIDIPVGPDEEGILWPVGSLDYIRQSIAASAEAPTSLTLNDFGNVNVLARVAPVATPDPRPVVGRYRSDAIDTEVSIRESSGGLRMDCAGRFGSTAYALECIADGVWRAKGHPAYLGGILSFDAREAGFDFSFGPGTISRLRFRRT